MYKRKVYGIFVDRNLNDRFVFRHIVYYNIVYYNYINRRSKSLKRWLFIVSEMNLLHLL